MPDGTVIHGPDGIRRYLGQRRTSLLTVLRRSFLSTLWGDGSVLLTAMTSTGLLLSCLSMITVSGSWFIKSLPVNHFIPNDKKTTHLFWSGDSRACD